LGVQYYYCDLGLDSDNSDLDFVDYIPELVEDGPEPAHSNMHIQPVVLDNHILDYNVEVDQLKISLHIVGSTTVAAT
jgi:hypothetical protein